MKEIDFDDWDIEEEEKCDYIYLVDILKKYNHIDRFFIKIPIRGKGFFKKFYNGLNTNDYEYLINYISERNNLIHHDRSIYLLINKKRERTYGWTPINKSDYKYCIKNKYEYLSIDIKINLNE